MFTISRNNIVSQIQIQHLLKLNKFTYKGIAFSYAYSNTTLVKVKSNWAGGVLTAKGIQIQHLLKLNKDIGSELEGNRYVFKYNTC